ncbi:hypothetical protein F4859DRAFT_73277 [Xylaria cf. heliscus]|nr:hypothetical protein F4859DRAFT_73277 [Xylaria cf. heliscus]
MEVNRAVRGLPQLDTMADSSAPGVKELPRTNSNWTSRKATELADCLYYLLGKTICNITTPHRVGLQLDGFKLDESCIQNILVQEILVSSCLTINSWNQCRCVSILPTSRTSEVESYVILSDICSSIHVIKSRPFDIHFDENDLWYNKSYFQSPTCNDNPGMLTLKYMLDCQFFSNGRDGEVFNRNDKAILTLSLARSLVHWLWMQGPWTAESIWFICVTDEIPDKHHPYVTCDLIKITEDGHQPINPTKNILWRWVLCFAQLLVEIETGNRMDIHPSYTPFMEFKTKVVSTMEPSKSYYARESYNRAIQNCLNFKLLLARESRNRTGDLLVSARNVLYNIIKPLEENFSLIPSLENTRRLRSLRILGYAPSHGPTTSTSKVTRGNAKEKRQSSSLPRPTMDSTTNAHFLLIMKECLRYTSLTEMATTMGYESIKARLFRELWDLRSRH